MLHDRPIRVHCSMGSVPLTADDRDADRNAGIALGMSPRAQVQSLTDTQDLPNSDSG